MEPSLQLKKPGDFEKTKGSPPISEPANTGGDKHTFVPLAKEAGDEEADIQLYEPYDHRKVDHPTTNFETWMLLLKGSLGTGILAMPNAYNDAGLLVGTIGTVLIGLVCTHSMHVLVRCQYLLCKRAKLPALNYGHSLRLALKDGPVLLSWLAPCANGLVNTFLVKYHFCVCTMYVMFVVDNMKQVSAV